MIWQPDLCAALEKQGCRVALQAPMAPYTTFRIGGPADAVITAPSAQALAEALRLCREHELPVTLIGKGSNLLVSDDGIEGAVVRLDDRSQPITCDPATGMVTAFAGVSIGRLCREARDHGLTGLEFAFGIPGSVGGGVYMNAGAYGGQFADVLHSVTLLSPETGTLRTAPAAELQLDYRHSALMQTNEVVVDATFRLSAGNVEAITARMKELMAKRRDKQPLEYPSAGSFFKRPQGHFAAALIDQCGLKGFAVGDAQVSEKHAGFVINRGHATCRDMIALKREVCRRVWEQCQVALEPEVALIGRNVSW